MIRLWRKLKRFFTKYSLSQIQADRFGDAVREQLEQERLKRIYLRPKSIGTKHE